MNHPIGAAVHFWFPSNDGEQTACGVVATALPIESWTVEIARVSCKYCREQISFVGRSYCKARRSQQIDW